MLGDPSSGPCKEVMVRDSQGQCLPTVAALAQRWRIEGAACLKRKVLQILHRLVSGILIKPLFWQCFPFHLHQGIVPSEIVYIASRRMCPAHKNRLTTHALTMPVYQVSAAGAMLL